MASPARVLMVTGSYPPMRCGVGDYTAQLARALSEQPDITLQVLTTQLAEPRSDDPAWVRRLMPGWRASALSKLLTVTREFMPDVLHMQYPTQGYRSLSGPTLLPLYARLRLRVPVVMTLHEYLPPPLTVHAVPFWGAAAAASAVIVVRPDYQARMTGPIAWLMRHTPLRLIPNASVIPALELSAAERAALRERIGCGNRQIVSYFGFAYPHKAVEQLFDIADPDHHHLLLIGELVPSDDYHRRLLALADSDRWRGRVTVTGYVGPQEAARLLALSDAAVFPFSGGGGVWNSSLHAATSQGTFTVVTSGDRRGYSEQENVYYAAPGAVQEMRAALARHAGIRLPPAASHLERLWSEIASMHSEFYRTLLTRRPK